MPTIRYILNTEERMTDCQCIRRAKAADMGLLLFFVSIVLFSMVVIGNYVQKGIERLRGMSGDQPVQASPLIELTHEGAFSVCEDCAPKIIQCAQGIGYCANEKCVFYKGRWT